jgi:hypothetical protein
LLGRAGIARFDLRQDSSDIFHEAAIIQQMNPSSACKSRRYGHPLDWAGCHFLVNSSDKRAILSGSCHQGNLILAISHIEGDNCVAYRFSNFSEDHKACWTRKG